LIFEASASKFRPQTGIFILYEVIKITGDTFKMKIVIAMDSFMDSLTAVRACQIVKESIASMVPAAEIIIRPMADGGEGTAKAMLSAGEGRWLERTVTGPLPDMNVKAGFVWFDDEKTALVEMAAASGLELLEPQSRNPFKTTTFGTGELIAEAAVYGAEKILLAVGGSATVDGGTGAAAALGFKFLDENGKEIYPCGGELSGISTIVPPPQPVGADVEVLCDVDNPLCGPHGAAKTYGPQKGATPQMVEKLEAGLLHLACLVKEQLGIDINNLAGGGAAGGLAAGAVAFMNAKLVSGIETIMVQSKLPQAIRGAQWLITGEGKFDHQSLRGKVVSGVAQLAEKAGAKVAVLAGQVLLEPQQYKNCGIDVAISCMNDDMTLEYAIENSEALLSRAALRLARENILTE